MTDKYIYLNDNKKIMNPMCSSNKSFVFTFHGELDNINFEHQTNNYESISQTLEPFNIKLKEIWYGKFKNSEDQIRSQFLVRSDNNRVFWQKYEGLAPGGCQNKIFIDGIQYKTTSWLAMSHTDRDAIINK